MSFADPRPALISRLEAEVALGWPEPWWPQDRPTHRMLLADLIDLLGEAVGSIPEGQHDRFGMKSHRYHERTAMPNKPKVDHLDHHATFTAECCAELRHEYGLDDSDIATELGIDPRDVDELIDSLEADRRLP